jgi:hypothetical protein
MIRGSGRKFELPDGMWVGFDEHYKYTGHQPYLKDKEGQDLVINLARKKVKGFV